MARANSIKRYLLSKLIELDLDVQNIEFNIYGNSNQNLELASYFNIFSSPTILVFFEGKEFKRYGRNISLDIFNSELKRLYEMVF